MSKYEPLWQAIGGRTEDSFTLTFAEIEEILGLSHRPRLSDLQEGIARLRLRGG